MAVQKLLGAIIDGVGLSAGRSRFKNSRRNRASANHRAARHGEWGRTGGAAGGGELDAEVFGVCIVVTRAPNGVTH